MGSPIAMGLSVLSAGASAAGAVQSAQAQKDSLNYQATVAAQNAAISDQRAKMALQIGAQDENTVRQTTAQHAATQKASFAGNGVDVNDGSAAETQAGTKFEGEVSALTVRDNAARAAWADNVDASNQRNNASYLSSAANAVNPGMAGLTSLLSSASSSARTYKPGT